MRKTLANCLLFFIVLYVHSGQSMPMGSIKPYIDICKKLMKVKSGMSFSTATVPDEDDQSMILSLHNQARRNVANQEDRSLQAQNMMEMTWDDELAKIAIKQLEACPVAGEEGNYMEVGQNVYLVEDPLNETVSWWTALESWNENAANYNYQPFNASINNGKWNSYTQMIWASSSKIGCALKKFTGTSGSQSYLLNCAYKEKGNVEGEKPYEQGQVCSSCPTGTECNDHLCSTKSVSKIVPFSAAAVSDCPVGGWMIC